MTKNILSVGEHHIATLPLRDVVVFPGMIFPLFVGRKKSINSLQASYKTGKKVFLITQKNSSVDNVSKKDLHKVGVVGYIIQMLKLPDGTVKVLVDAKQRAELVSLDNENLFIATIKIKQEIYTNASEDNALVNLIKEKYREYVKLEDRLPEDLIDVIFEMTDVSKLIDHIISSLSLDLKEKQSILEEFNINKRLKETYNIVNREYDVLSAEKNIKIQVKQQVDNNQKEYYLNEQLKAIKKELGDGEAGTEAKEFETLINNKKLSKEAKKKSEAELKRFKMMNPISADAGIVRTYLEWLLSLPWGKTNKIRIDLDKATKILDDEHYGLEKVKERILEFIAVNRRVKKLNGSILCLIGPPGVGKTSLAKSIAKSMGRKFAKISLGGMRDEAEIRGHRRTYIGALPGKIIQLLKKTETDNPLFLLDEIDKIGKDFRGDPASALLEVLDPEQNTMFNDHFLEVDYDLSNIMFITTANSYDIPYALRDRLEIIKLSGYTDDEKLNIANKYLIKKQLKLNGLKKEEFSLNDETLLKLIHNYTYEAGVRNLEREIANLFRKIVKKIDTGKEEKPIVINKENLEDFAGVPKFDYRKIEEKNLVGITTGLAYTEVGGDTLVIEAVKIPGDGKITFTGKLGDVMKESMQAAFSYFRSQCQEYGITPDEYKKYDIHIHVPEGATPKDGPSAGIAICTSIVSVMTNIPVDKFVAMTGEITLRGRVLPIGGLKEKLLSAIRAGIKKVIIPEKNAKDLKELPEKIAKELEIITVDNVSKVIQIALAGTPKKLSLTKKKSNNEQLVSH